MIRSQVSAVGRVGTVGTFCQRAPDRGTRFLRRSALPVDFTLETTPRHPARGGRSMELPVNPLRERVGCPGHAGQVLHARRLYALEAAEVREQRAPARRTDAADLLQR